MKSGPGDTRGLLFSTLFNLIESICQKNMHMGCDGKGRRRGFLYERQMSVQPSKSVDEDLALLRSVRARRTHSV